MVSHTILTTVQAVAADIPLAVDQQARGYGLAVDKAAALGMKIKLLVKATARWRVAAAALDTFPDLQ
jgi:post-segregation antitoxin (ccd killing protein)